MVLIRSMDGLLAGVIQEYDDCYGSHAENNQDGAHRRRVTVLLHGSSVCPGPAYWKGIWAGLALIRVDPMPGTTDRRSAHCDLVGDGAVPLTFDCSTLPRRKDIACVWSNPSGAEICAS